MSTILVTGATSGFGRLIAQELHERGHTVVGTSRAPSSADRGDFPLIELDVTDDDSVTAGVAAAVAQAGPLDVVVNNVGRGSWGIQEAFTAQQLQQLLELNAIGAYRVDRAVLPAMRERGSGLLIHVSTLAGRLVIPFMGPYAAAKHALEAIAEGFATELAGTGVESVLVEPQSYPTAGALDGMMFPNDDTRARGYGRLADYASSAFEQNDQQLRSNEASDPAEVAEAVAALVDSPTGSRPLRITVGGPMTQLVTGVNAAAEEARGQLLGFMGLQTGGA